MKIEKFRIKNYKSIEDSEDCYLSEGITILAGKNESGKTSILEALEDFDTQKKIRKGAIPIKDPSLKPEISISFILDEEYSNEILLELGLNIGFKISSLKFEITKKYPQKYTLDPEIINTLADFVLIRDKDKTEDLKEKIAIATNDLRKKYSRYIDIPSSVFEFILSKSNDPSEIIDDFKNIIINIENHIIDEDLEEFEEVSEKYLKRFEKYNHDSSIKDKFIEEIKRYIPNFILFSSFEDVFPNKIPLSEIDKNKWIKDLSIVSDLKVHKILDSTDRELRKHKNDVNVKLNNDYENFWTQDLSKLSIDWDSQHLFFWIEEDGYSYEPEIRSKGRQWHLAFYIRVSARSKENAPNIILIDEPGLYLHANAQKDILKKLEDSSKDCQIVFATHSPYLLEPDKLNRVRLIEKSKKEGVKILNKIHAVSDKETLTPILTAIGLELNNGITNIDRINNIIVEGPSDKYYFDAFKLILANKDLNFIYGGGAGNMPFVGTILQGWGCKVNYLFDNDKGMVDGEKNLIKNWFITKDIISSVSESFGAIEDIFSRDDFKKHVLNEENKTYTSTNSSYVKKSKNDKVLIAKLFLEKVEKNNLKLSKETTSNITNLFTKLINKFK